MSKESYLRKVMRQAFKKPSPKLQAVLKNPNLSDAEKKVAMATFKENKAKNIQRLSDPVERDLNRNIGQEQNIDETANPEGEPQDETFGQPVDQSSGNEFQNRSIARNIPESKPAQSPPSLSGEQAKASAPPDKDVSKETLRPTNKPFGGLAERGKNLLGRIPGFNKSGNQTGESAESGGGGEGKQGSRFDKAIQAGKKFAQQQIKKMALKFVASNPTVWIVIGCLLALIIVIVMFAAFWSQISDFMGNGPSRSGTTLSQPVNPLQDKEWIQRVLMNANDPNAIAKIAEMDIGKLSAELNSIIVDPSVDSEIKAQTQKVLDAVTAFSGPKDKINGKKIIDGIVALHNLIGSIPAYPAGKAQMPLKITGYSTGKTPHGKSIAVPDKNTDGHNIVVDGRNGNVFITEKQCDALDLVVPGNLQGQGTNGPKVYPVFAGKVVAKWVLVGKKQTSDVVIISDDIGYSALYTDIDSSLQVGQSVDLNTPVGWVPFRLFHMEFSYKGRCMATTKSEKQQWANNGNKPTYGDFMLGHLKSFVGVQ